MAPTFEQELEKLINKHSIENESDTPDFILAAFLTGVLQIWNAAVMRREDWYADAEAHDDTATPSDIEEALNTGASAFEEAKRKYQAETTILPPDLMQTMKEIHQARTEFRTSCRQILWRSLENVDAYADSIGDVSVGEAYSGWVENLMLMIGAQIEDDPSESKPS